MISRVNVNGQVYDIDGFDFNITRHEESKKVNKFDLVYLTKEEYTQKYNNNEIDDDTFYCTDFDGDNGLEGGATGMGLPFGGTPGQTLVKNSNENGDASWQDLVALPVGGTSGQILTKIDNTDGNAEWSDFPSLNYLPLEGGTVTGVTTFSNTTDASSTATGAVKISGGLGVAKTIRANQVFGGVYNDYAEFRICHELFKAGQVVCENGDDTLSISKERMQPAGWIVSDTYGFCIGKTKEAICPVAVSGRVLAYINESKEMYCVGDAVCAGPNGTVSKMTREEIVQFPDRIIGIVSAIPNYEVWGKENIAVNGRIWIKVR